MNKIVILIILVGVGLGYLYFQNDQPAKQNEQNYQFTQQETQIKKVSIENKAKCQKDGLQFYREHETKASDSSLGYTVFGNQSYAFNQDLNTCLISWEDSQIYPNGTARHTRHITDIYSNNDVYSWWQRDTIKTGQVENLMGSENEFNQMLQRYGLY